MQLHQETKDSHAKVDDDFLEFCNVAPNTNRQSVKEIWRLDSNQASRIQIPSWLTSLLQDYTLALAVESSVPFLVRFRVDAILHHTLAMAKERTLEGANAEHGLVLSLTPDDITSLFETLFWGYQQVICLPHTFATKGDVLECAADYVLWYGDQRKLETNLVLIQAEEPIDGHGDQCLPVLAAMSIIQHNRTQGGRNKETYGLFTDSFRWIFFHLNEKNECSSWELNWMEGQQQTIICQLCKILDKAIVMKLLSDGGEWQQSFEHQSRWTVLTNEPSECGESETEDNMSDSDCESGYREVVTDFMSFSMEWFSKLEDKVRQFSSRFKDDKFNTELGEAFKLARTESQKDKKSFKLPTIAVTDIRPQDVYPTFYLKGDDEAGDEWHLKPQERRPVPEHLRAILSDYAQALGDADQNEEVTRARLDYGQEKDKGKRTSTQSTASFKSLHWQFETPIKFPWRYKGKVHLISGRTDYSLWYGGPNEAETNMVVVEARKRGSTGKAGRANTAIYGISTDSYSWTFLRLGANEKVSSHYLVWNEGKQVEIISQIHRIMSHAAVLSPASTNVSGKQPSVEEETGLSWGD
ncbi:hypothetical protein BDW59DRAFT_179191 [Aspergillus cavernicola]|uniref:Uncharacterized protein n=1 Tax=Aspergillus cavernicola TaxID=176166 RepID=A0ABR4IK49_9EURO